MYLGQREHHPETGLNEVRILFAQEIMVQVGRRVGAMFDTALDMLGCPRGVIHVHHGTIVSEGLEISAGMVRDVVDVIGQVGWSSHLVYKLFPGDGIMEAVG